LKKGELKRRDFLVLILSKHLLLFISYINTLKMMKKLQEIMKKTSLITIFSVKIYKIGL